MKGEHLECKSQTTMPMIYQIKDESTGKQLTIVDTPGLNDTNGNSTDEQHIQSIIHAIFLVGGVHMICIVNRASEARLTNSIELALNRLINIFSKSCRKNFAVCMTNSPSAIPPNCLDFLKKLDIPNQHIFRFENNCLVHPNRFRKLSNKMFGEVHDDVEDIIDSNSKYWKQNVKSINLLVETCNSFGLIDIEGVKSLFFQRESFDKQTQYFAEKVRLIEEKRENLLEKNKLVQKYQKEAESNKDFVTKRIALQKKTRVVTKQRKVKRYHPYSQAKQENRRDNWWWYQKLGYGIADSLTFGRYSKNDRQHSIEQEAKGRVLEGYFDWVIENYQEEENYFVEVELPSVDEAQKSIHDHAKQEQQTAENFILEIKSELKKADEELESCLYLLGYLTEELEKNAAGNIVSIDTLIENTKREIGYLFSKYSDGHRIFLNNSEFAKDTSTREKVIALEARIEKLNREKKIVAMARSEKRDKSSSAKFTEAFAKLQLELSEEMANEGNKLSCFRELFSKMKPNSINTTRSHSSQA